MYVKKILFSFLVFAILGFYQSGEPINGWSAFAKVKFKEKFNKEVNGNLNYPVFNEQIKELEGKEVSLLGYCMPFEMGPNAVILSSNPYSSCFFCGGAGPESVAEVYFKHSTGKFKPDQLIKVKGILKLNDSDMDRLNFILEDAEIIKK